MTVTVETVLGRVDQDVQRFIHNQAPGMLKDDIQTEAFNMILSLRRLRADFIRDGQMIHHAHIERCSTYIQRLLGYLDHQGIARPPSPEEHLRQAGFA